MPQTFIHHSRLLSHGAPTGIKRFDPGLNLQDQKDQEVFVPEINQTLYFKVSNETHAKCISFSEFLRNVNGVNIMHYHNKKATLFWLKNTENSFWVRMRGSV